MGRGKGRKKGGARAGVLRSFEATGRRCRWWREDEVRGGGLAVLGAPASLSGGWRRSWRGEGRCGRGDGG